MHARFESNFARLRLRHDGSAMMGGQRSARGTRARVRWVWPVRLSRGARACLRPASNVGRAAATSGNEALRIAVRREKGRGGHRGG